MSEEHRSPARRTDHEASLIMGAAAGDIEGSEEQEYAALAAADPSVLDETRELAELLGRVGELPGWTEPAADEELGTRVLALADEPSPGRIPEPPGRRLLPAAAAAVVLLVLGGFAGSWLGDLADRPPAGGPGTLGAVEPIDFVGEPASVDIEASLVAHTWGTETVLDMDGWEPGAAYDLVLVADDGSTEDAGSFLGSEVAVDCRMNGALLREDVDAVEIRDSAGRVVASSDVPAVSAD